MTENPQQQRTGRARDVHWRLDPQLVRKLQERAYNSGVSVALLANRLLDDAIRELEGRERSHEN